MKRLCVFSMLIICPVSLWADTLSVGPGGYSTIQSAIDDANSGDTVVVAPDTYIENIDFLGKAITVRSTDPNDPNIVAVTIIDGSNPQDPNLASVVTFKSGEGSDSVLSGFTITGGTGSWLPVSWEFQGLRWNRCGGGVVCCNMSAPTVTKNLFVDNTAGQGGGIYIYGDPVNPNNPSNPTVHISPVIADNTFINNSVVEEHGFSPPDANYPANDHGDGGAIVAFQGCDPVITGNLIENNHADSYGGGIHLRQWSNGSIAENQILDNDSRLGAGIHITYTSSPSVSDNTIRRNTASSLGGGGIYVYYLSGPLIERNLITDNTSSNGAGICVYYSSAGTIRNNLICRNNAGAGIRIVGSTPTITNNTIADNYNGGIDCQPNSNPQIENNIIASNGFGWAVRVSNDSSPIIRYNNLWDNDSGTTGPAIPDQTGINGNISTNPDFVAPDTNDYHLDYDSPCINTGDPNFTGSDQNDYDGRPRIMGQYVDIGAYETSPVWNITTYTGYDTIQQAVDDANDGQTIVLTIGTHTGDGNRDIRFYGKSITVQSTNPNNWDIVAATIIDSNGYDPELHRAFHFRDGEDANAVVAGLTITGGGGVYDGGAIKCTNASSPTIKNCIITDNYSGGRGTIYTEHYSNPLIVNCAITNNVATRGYGAAVCAFYDSSPTILNCLIANNHAVGAGHHGGGIYCHDHSDALIANCIITANTADHRGGGIAAYWSSPTYINCTIIGNTSLEGGGLSSFRESNPLVVNCIVRDNIAPDGNQIALINTLRIWGVNIPTEMTVLFSDIEGAQSQATIDPDCTLHWGDGNIDIDPNFVNPGHWDDANTPAEPNDDFFITGNYHLLPSSGCIDIGDNNSLPALLTTDIDGEQRIFDSRVDIGADEVVTNPFDLDTDGIVDYYELGLLTDEWLITGGGLQTDFYTDGIIDFADYALLANEWLWKAGWYE